MKEFTSVAELQANYRAVKSRLPPYEHRVTNLAKQVEPEPEPEPAPRSVKPLPLRPLRRVSQIVIEHYDIDWSTLSGPKRFGHIVRPRQVFCYVCHRVCGESLNRIGDFIRRDHSTVISGVQRIENLIPIDEELARDVEQITAKYREGL